MTTAEIPAGMIDSRLVEILPDGRQEGQGYFTQRGLAENLCSFMQRINPASKYVVVPMHPELSLPSTTGRRGKTK